MATKRPFRFGVQLHGAPDAKAWAEAARKAEDLGYSTLFMPDHFGDQLAPIPALAAAAAATSSLRIGMLVLGNDYRHPVVLAKEAATLDLLSDGRLELGVGAGWMRTDYEQSGLPYDGAGTRIERLGESVAILKGLMGDAPLSYGGSHYTITGLEGHPKPVQRPHPPILMGGGGRKMLQLAAREADIVGINVNLAAGEVTPDAGKNATADRTREKIGWVREAAGDRFDDIELSVSAYVAMVTDDRRGTAEMLAGGFGITADEALETPHALVGTVEEIAEQCVERREEHGISYVVVNEAGFEPLAPVIGRLAGT